MGFEPRPNQGGEFGYSENAADYIATLETIRGALETSDATAVGLEGGGRMFAAVLSPLSEYGAREGDDHLVLTVEESCAEDDPSRATGYRLALYHLAKDRSELYPSEWSEFVVDFSREDLAEHDEDVASPPTSARALNR